MEYSLAAGIFTWLTVSGMAAAAAFVRRTPSARQAFFAYFGKASRQAAAAAAAFLLAVSVLLSVPGGDVPLLVGAAQTVGAGLPEAGASAPFADKLDSGEPLKHALPAVQPKASRSLGIANDTLIAFIAGGVTAFFALLATAAVLAKKRGTGFAEGVAALGTFFWRPAMITGVFCWLAAVWVRVVWPDWHIFGTSAEGTDLFAAFLCVLPWAACLACWIVLGAFLKNARQIASK
jgi:hypothetical protein